MAEPPATPKAYAKQQGIRRSKITKAMKRRKVLDLRASGFSTVEIAEHMNHLAQTEDKPAWRTTPNGVDRILNNALADYANADEAQIEKVRALQLHRIDIATQQVMLLVKKGNLKAVDRLVRLEQLRARIAGTESAQRVEHSGVIDHRVERGEVERLEQAWLAGNTVEGTAHEVTDDDLAALPAGDA